MPLTKPPESLVFASLAELYEQFCDLLVSKEFGCPRGIRVVIGREHFFHLTKLQKGWQTQFDIPTEEPLIKATIQGFGGYTINEKRAQTLSWIPEILREPHEIWEYETKKTAEEVFIREYDKAGSPFRAVLLAREGGSLRPVTCMTVRRTGIKEHRKGKKLWPLQEEKENSHSG
jgi:hypothetical protein